MTSPHSRWSGAGVLMLLGALQAGCGDDAVAPAYIGKVTDTGSDAVVGMISDGDRVQLYLCGGKTTYATLSHWFQGPLATDGTFSIESGAFTATGDVGAGTGKIKTDDGQTLSWSVRPAQGELEGLYAAMDGSCRTGAVVGDFDGNGVVDLQGTWCNGEGRFAQVTPLRLLTLGDLGVQVTVQIDPPKSLYVDRVRAP